MNITNTRLRERGGYPRDRAIVSVLSYLVAVFRLYLLEMSRCFGDRLKPGTKKQPYE